MGVKINISKEDRVEILRMYDDEKKSKMDIIRKYGFSQNVVDRILSEENSIRFKIYHS